MRQILELQAALLTSPPPPTTIDRNIVAVKLIGACSALANLRHAALVFYELFRPNLIAWNAYLKALAQHNQWAHTLSCFRSMLCQSSSTNVIPDEYTFTSVVKACAGLLSVIEGEKAHGMVLRQGFQNEMFAEAIKLFREMQRIAGLMPNDVTLVSVLSACANLGALDLGKWVDRFIKAKRMELNLFLENALSDMYVKCGCVAEARDVFNKMPERDVISLSIIISGLAMHGYAEEALECFHEMLDRGIRPNDFVFMGVLSACTHAGLVEDGLKYFDMMQIKFRIDPVVEHYGCMVDLLSRSGRLDEAERMIRSMLVPPNVIVWGALLGGCKIYKDVTMIGSELLSVEEDDWKESSTLEDGEILLLEAGPCNSKGE